MKLRKLKKMLSITVASAMLLNCVPVGSVSNDSNTTVSTSENQNESEPQTEKVSESEKTTEKVVESEKQSETAAESEKTTEAAESETEAETAAESGKQASETVKNEPETEKTTDKETEQKEETNDKKLRRMAITEVEKITATWKVDGETVSNNAKFTWNGKAKVLKHEVTNAENATISVAIERDGTEVDEIKEPGTYKITLTAKVNTSPINVENATLNLTVEKAKITALNWDGLEKEYTGKGIALPNATFASAVEGESALVADVAVVTEDQGKLTNGQVINIGSYGVVASLTEEQDKYYQFAADFEEDAKKNTLEVSKKKVSVVWTADGNTFNPEEGLTWNGAEHSVRATAEKVDLGNVTFTFNGSGSDSIKEPGEYTAAVTTENTNVELQNATITFKVNKAVISSLNWDGTTATYTGKNIDLPTATFASAVNQKEETLNVEFEDAGVTQAVNAGSYKVIAKLSDAQAEYYRFADGLDATETLNVGTKEVNVTWSAQDKAEYTWDSQKKTPTYSMETDLKLNPKMTIKWKGADGETTVDDVKEPGTYTLTVSTEDKNVVLKNATITLIVNKAIISNLTWDGTTATYASKARTLPTAAFVSGVEGEDVLEAEVAVAAADQGKLINGAVINAGEYTVAAALTADQAKYYVFASECNTEEKFVVKQLKVEVTPEADQCKVYGEDEPKLEYDVKYDSEEISDTTVKEELTENILSRETGDTVGEYKISWNDEEKATKTNYDLTLGKEDEVFTINKLEVTVIPKDDQWKLYGEVDPEYYDYDVEINPESKTTITVDAARTELGNDLLTRTEGQNIGKYAYVFADESVTKDGLENYNYVCMFQDAQEAEEPLFEIRQLTINEVEAINSRQETFDISINLDDEKKETEEDKKVDIRLKITVEADDWAASNDIAYPQDVTKYFGGKAEDQASYITLNTEYGKDTITINDDVVFTKTGKNGEELSWKGNLPAGTTLTMVLVDEAGNEASKPITTTVGKTTIALKDWTGYKVSTTGNYINPDDAEAKALSIASEGADRNEMVEMVYHNGKKESTSYAELTASLTPVSSNEGSTHLTQTVKANIVDTLNLNCESKSLTFYVDDQAFTIPGSSVQFENRGEEITIKLPEMGTVTSVTIAGAEVEVNSTLGNEFTFPVSWSGKSLISTGTGISIEYQDEAGHTGTSTGASASRSSVSTPIQFKIRPELNVNGYLNGRSNTLIISGTACVCEPIRVTVADMDQSTYATQKETWSDSNGSWEVLFDMSRLPEGQDFLISAEYMDVDGAGYSITARFDAFCASAAVQSPIYEAMTYISGMVEPGTAVALVINGEQDSYYEVEVDRFGHFALDDIPMMFEGEYFDIYVTDIAGNVSIRRYEIPEAGDPFEVTALVNPLGKFFYTAEETDSEVYMATPVFADTFIDEDEKEVDLVELPLLLGMSYEVGTLSLQKTENGFTVTSQIQVSDEISPEDYRIENEKLYVYTSRPTVNELKNKTGEEYGYGEEIRLGENETVWIVNESEMTILADDMMELELFDYEESEEYEDYQELY